MHQAFEIHRFDQTPLLIKSLPVSIYLYSSIDQLFLGSIDGSLYIYSINNNNQEDQINNLNLNLIKVIINFSSKLGSTKIQHHQSINTHSPSIEGLSVIKEINSLVILSGGDISLFDLSDFKLQSNCERWTKFQASSMCLETSILRQNEQGLILDLALMSNTNQTLHQSNPQSETNLGLLSKFDIPVLVTILAVPCKRRLILFAWKDGQWLTPKEINLPHQVRSLAFATPLKLFVGYSTGDYATLKINLPSENRGTIGHEISDAFPSPITHLPNRITENSNLAGNHPASSSNTTTSVSKLGGLSSLAFKTTGLVSLGLSGSSKVAKNPVIKVGPPTHEIIGMRDQIATFMNFDGKLSRTQALSSVNHNLPSSILYSAPPTETIIRHPYVLSILPSTVSSPETLAVHSVPTLSHVQDLRLPPTQTAQSELAANNAPPGKWAPDPSSSRSPAHRLLTTSSSSTGLAFLIASEWCLKENSMQYWIECLRMKPWSEQIQQLIQTGDYEESLGLMEGLDELSLPNKASLVKRLNALCAVVQFSKHKYDQAIDRFISLSINPAKVVALYPAQISGKLAKRREEWEQLFDGRSIESYLGMNLDLGGSLTSVPHEPSSQPSSDLGTGSKRSSFIQPPKTTVTSSLLDEDRASVRSGRSARLNSLKARPSESSIRKPNIDVFSHDSNFKPSVDVLIRYLTDRRQNVNKAIAHLNGIDTQRLKSTSEGEISPIESLKKTALLPPVELFRLEDQTITEVTDIGHIVQIAKIVDTTLFKCYLAIKPTMLGPLCRLPNWCEVDEVEALLMNAKRYHELLDLYHGKGQHDRALILLKKMGENEEELDLRIDPSIRYLQKLGSKHLDLILNTSRWVFSLCADSINLIRAALEIFIADLSTVESLPRSIVMSFLEKENLTACRFYLEHLIHNLEEKTSTFHEKLIHIYIIEFKRLRSSTDLEEARKMYDKLLDHLLQSQHYSPNWVLGRLPHDDMYEARALTLGRMGQHNAALSIYVYRLANLRSAEEYCKRNYAQSPDTNGAIFLTLLKIYLRPTPSISTDHGNKIGEITEVLKLLPSLLSLDKLQTFVLRSFRKLTQTSKEMKIVKECSESRLNQLDLGLKVLESRRVKIEEKRLCVGCGKRIGNSVIAVHPPYGEVTHYQCRERFLTSERRL